ncbi:CD225/dispanin family protein [Sphingobacterium oryzagri]|uniref:CD225/dispanin family protein n=1 Tax=Sphingobacterium oryzagri TaxID=3025669 RepID=A0ABY7WP94_9SPHI|nr:CD225/dispanin family protein [Sphingobacterium sp. KACC 22765]WDF69164.1 CD225/dispanin family protein [Sphingobacterium sp. KACC 22765]
MQKYHYTDGTNSFGPFSITELQEKNITADTYVWTEGLPTWIPARQVPELAPILRTEDQPYFTASNQPPPAQFPNVGAPVYTQASGRPPKTYLIETILTTIFCCWPLGIASIIYASRVEKKFYAGDYLGAERDSANAKKWMWINVGACIVLWILYFLIFGVAMFGALVGGDSYSDF